MTSESHKEEAVNIEEFSDDTLAEMSDGYAREADRLFRLARGAHAELTARMVERDATKLDTEHWTGTMKPGAISHTVEDLPLFRKRLATLLGKEQIEAAFVQPPTPPLRVDHRFINDYHKQGGVIASVIDDFRKSVRGDSRLVLERKPEKEGQQSGDPD